MSVLNQKLAELPNNPGVYLYKDKYGQIIYVGKAAVLKNRVRQYFQKGRPTDTKTQVLVSEIVDVDWITVDSEIDALFLEAELIRRYKPKFNILLRDDKSTVYVRINYKDDYPSVTLTRRPLDDKATYFGPYFSAHSVKKALHHLRKIFPYSTHSRTVPKRACLQYHLGLCPGLEEGNTTLAAYKQDLKKLMQYLRGERVQLTRQIESDMKSAAKSKDFERAALLRNQLSALKSLSKQIVFSDKEYLDISKDEGLYGLAQLLGLPKPPKRVEGYDISHMSGTDNVASMVVFSNGVPNKTQYRKFKMNRPGNDDFAHMDEAISRRLSEKNIKAWGRADLILIDGGKGQLQAALEARQSVGENIPMIGLAKREEEIVIAKADIAIKLQKPANALIKESDKYVTVLLPKNSSVVKLLQRVRDESHRFAVSYHSVLKRQRQTNSILEEIPGIGPKTRQQLLRHFGSMKSLLSAKEDDVAGVVGKSKAKLIRQYTKGV